MAIKDRCSSSKDIQKFSSTDTSSSQHTNFNLNHGHIKTVNDNIVSKSTSSGSQIKNNDYSSCANDFSSQKSSKTKSWKEKDKSPKSSPYLKTDEKENEKQLKNDKNSKKNSSTLSLHIAAYEKSIEGEVSDTNSKEKTIQTTENLSNITAGPSSDHENPVKIPRQIHEDQVIQETVPYQASQKLRNLEGSKSSPVNSIFDNSKSNLQFRVRKTESNAGPPKLLIDENGIVQVCVPPTTTGWTNYNQTRSFNGVFVCLRANKKGWIVLVKKFHQTLLTFGIEKEPNSDDLSVQLNRTSLSNVFEMLEIDGPNITINGSIHSKNIMLISSGNIRINSPVYTEYFEMCAIGRIIVSNIVYCNHLEAKSGGHFWLDGKITKENGAETPADCFTFNIDSKYLHIGTNGVIGAGNGTVCSYVEGQICCELRNYGNIYAKEALKLRIKQLNSVQENQEDTAHRLPEAYANIKNIDFKRMSDKCMSDKDITKEKLNQSFYTEKDDGSRNQHSAIKSYKDIQQRRRGTIRSKMLNIVFDDNCDDLSQIQGDFVWLTINGSAMCEPNSTWITGTLEMVVMGSLLFAGDVNLDFASINVHEHFECLSGTNLEVAANLNLEATRVSTDAMWKIHNVLSLKVYENCSFTKNSNLEALSMEGIVYGDTKVSGSWLLDSLKIEVNNLITTNTSSLTIKEAQVAVKNLLSNGGQWEVENNLKLFTTFIQQNDDARINVGNSAVIEASCSSANGWKGRVNAKNLQIISTGKLECNSIVTSMTSEIVLLDKSDPTGNSSNPKASFIISNDFTVQNGPLVVIGNDFLSTELFDTSDPHGKIQPKFIGLKICSKIQAQALHAPKVAVELTSKANITLSNNEKVEEGKNLAMINVGYLKTSKGSEIIASCMENVCQSFNMEKKWIHEGTLTVTTSSSLFCTPIITNKGKIQRLNGDALSEALFKTEKYFYNYSQIEAGKLFLQGGEVFQNFGKIDASIDMKIVEFQDVINDGKISANEAVIAIQNTFNNAGHWSIKNNLDLTSKILGQGYSGGMTIGNNAIIKTFSSSKHGWNGTFDAQNLLLFVFGELKCNARVITSTAEVWISDQNINESKACFKMGGDFSVKQSSLKIYGDSDLSVEEMQLPDPDGKIIPKHISFELSGNLYSQALHAPKIAVELTSNANVVLEANETVQDEEGFMILNVGYLHTQPNSSIFASCSRNSFLKVNCETKVIHEGLWECSDSSFIAHSIVNHGKIQLHNSAKTGEFYFESIKDFNNYGLIASEKLFLHGGGTLSNHGFIAAIQTVGAEFTNILNHGCIKANFVNLVYKTTDVTSLGGYVAAQNSLIIDAEKSKKFSMECKSTPDSDFMLPKQYFAICSETIEINAPITNSVTSKNLTTFVAADGISICKPFTFSQLLVQGSKSDAEFHFDVCNGGSIQGDYAEVNCIQQKAVMKFDGEANLKLMNIANNLPTLVLSAKAKICINQILMNNTELLLGNLSEFAVKEIQAAKLEILPAHEVNIRSPGGLTVINVLKSFAINGSLNLHNNLNIFSEPQTGTTGQINGKITGLASENEFLIDVETLAMNGEIKNMNDVKLENEWLTINGCLKSNKKVEIRNWGMLCSGSITDADEIFLQSFFVCSNNGKAEAKKLKIAVPFLFHFNLDGDGEPTLGFLTKDSLLSIESIIFACGESKLAAESIQNSSVLLLRFASLTMSTTPDNQQLTHWKNTVDKLSAAFSSSTDSTENIAEQLSNIYNTGNVNNEHLTNVTLNSEAKLYSELRSFAKNLKMNGIQSFDPQELLEALNRAHYSLQLSQFQEFKNRCLAVAKNMKKKFLSKIKLIGLHKLAGFNDVPTIDLNKKGIQETGYYSVNVGGHIEASENGIYQNFTKSWCNHGSLKSAGDIEIHSDKVYQSKYGKAVAMYGDIFLEGGRAEIVNFENFGPFLAKFRDDLIAQNINSKIAQMKAGATLKIFNAYVDEAIVEAGQKAKVRKLKAKNVRVKGKAGVEFSGNASDKICLQSENGNVSLVGKVETEKLFISASDVVDLVYNDKADHKIGSIKTKSDRMNRVNEFLRGTGIFSEMKIRDQLGLEVLDETIIMCNIDRKCTRVEVKAKSVDVYGTNSFDKSVSIEASQHLNTHGASINAGEEIRLVLKSDKENLQLKESCLKSQNVKIKAEKGIDALANSNTGRGTSIIAPNFEMEAKKDIIFEGSNIVGNGTIKAGGNVVAKPAEIRRSITNSSSTWYGKRTYERKEWVDVYRPKFKGDMSISAGNTAKFTATELVGNFSIFGENGVDILSRITEETHAKSTSYLGGFEAFGSSGGTNNSKCTSSVINGNINVNSKNGDVKAEAEINTSKAIFSGKNVELARNVLRKTENSKEWGWNNIGCKVTTKNQSSETLSGSYLNSGELIINAENEFKSSLPLNIINDAYVKAKHTHLKGQQLHSSENSETTSFELLLIARAANLSFENKSSKSSESERQETNIGRTLTIDSESFTLDNAYIAGNIEGKVKNLTVISKCSTKEEEYTKHKVGVSLMNCGGSIVPIPDYSYEKKQFAEAKVKKPAGIHFKNLENFHVGHLHNEGGIITSEGDVRKFYDTATFKDVAENAKAESSSFEIGATTDFAGKFDTLNLGFSMSEETSKSNFRATIASTTNGKVDTSGEVNCDVQNARKLISESSISLGAGLSVGKNKFGIRSEVNGYGAGYKIGKDGLEGSLRVKGFKASAGFNPSLIKTDETTKLSITNIEIPFAKEHINGNATYDSEEGLSLHTETLDWIQNDLKITKKSFQFSSGVRSNETFLFHDLSEKGTKWRVQEREREITKDIWKYNSSKTREKAKIAGNGKSKKVKKPPPHLPKSSEATCTGEYSSSCLSYDNFENRALSVKNIPPDPELFEGIATGQMKSLAPHLTLRDDLLRQQYAAETSFFPR